MNAIFAGIENPLFARAHFEVVQRLMGLGLCGGGEAEGDLCRGAAGRDPVALGTQ